MTSGLDILTVTGTGRQRGRARGEAHRERMAAIAGKWRDDFAADPSGAAWAGRLDSFLDDFFGRTGFEAAIARWTADPLDEVRGMAEASGIPFRTMLAFQLWDEMLVSRLSHKPVSSGDEGGRCSALAVDDAADGVTRVAQNMDVPFADGEQLLLKIIGEDGLETLLLTRATDLGLCGMNNAPLGVCCNTLAELSHSTAGLPVAFVVRGILARTDFAEAVRFVNEIPHASGQNYTIGAPGAIVSLECSAQTKVPYTPRPGLKRVFHANHALANDDRSATGRSCASPTSFARFAALERRLGDPARPVDLETIKETLRSRDDAAAPVSRERAAGQGDFAAFTFGSMICELDPQAPGLWMSRGPPSQRPYERAKLNPLPAT